jgi:phospholipid transport system transporter-binding protein
VESNGFKPGLELTFKSVVTVRNSLYQALLQETCGTFCIDLSEVTHCDSAGLALLIEVRKLCAQNNRAFKVFGISPETELLAEFCGVKGILESTVC